MKKLIRFIATLSIGVLISACATRVQMYQGDKLNNSKLASVALLGLDVIAIDNKPFQYKKGSILKFKPGLHAFTISKNLRGYVVSGNTMTGVHEKSENIKEIKIDLVAGENYRLIPDHKNSLDWYIRVDNPPMLGL